MFTPEPWKYPPPGDQAGPLSIQVDVMVPKDANEIDTAAFNQVAQSIVNNYYTQIQKWVDTNRQQLSIKGARDTYMARNLELPSIKAKHSYNSGQEKLLLQVYPELVGGNPSVAVETNLDGYIVWVQYDPYYPDEIISNGKAIYQYPGPYSIYMNGYSLTNNFMPRKPVGGYPILFGKTALLCASYAGSKADGEKNPIVKQHGIKLPNPVPPGWGNLGPAQAPDHTERGKIPNTFGYWIFDFVNSFNPVMCVQDNLTLENDGYQEASQAIPQNFVQPVFSEGLYFRDANNSILNPVGFNGMSVGNLGNLGDVEIWDFFFAEFYDRGKYRSNSFSWTIPPAPGQVVYLNDFPRWFGGFNYYSDYTYGGAGMDFNLDPKATAAGGQADDDSTQIDYDQGARQFSGTSSKYAITPQQAAAAQAWANQAHAELDDFLKQQNAAIAAVDDDLKSMGDEVLQAHMVAFVVRSIKGDATLFDNYFDDSTLYTGHDDEFLSKAGGPINITGQPIATETIIDGSAHGQPPTVTTTYGPTMSYYLPVPAANEDEYLSYLANVANGALGSPPYVQPAYAPYTISDTVVGPIETIKTNPNPTTPPNGQFFQSTSYYGLADLATAYVDNIMDAYQALEAQLKSLQQEQPPDPGKPPPEAGDDYTKFDYSNISISGDIWEYDQ